MGRATSRRLDVKKIIEARRRLREAGLYEPRREHDTCGVGAVVDTRGHSDRRVIDLGRQILLNLQHRGAASSDDVTGDGAGILMQIPHEFFRKECDALGIDLPPAGSYAVAMVFTPHNKELAEACCGLLGKAVQDRGLKVLGWREVPTDNGCLGDLAKSAEPVVRQVFVDGSPQRDEELERTLYMARKRAERLVLERYGARAEDFYIPSFSSRTIVYKGMFMAPQLFSYYPDLSDESMRSALCIVHQRYSTNTFPNWRLAQPFRMICHNGEINTLSGNAQRMRARQAKLASPLLGEDLRDLFPILQPGGSDSAWFDNALELLVRAGRSLPHALMMMIPEAFGPSYHISTDKRAFYEYHAAIMEPWDGPAAILVTDGILVGGTLDRNGLRPARYIVTVDGLLVLGSEVGVVSFPPEAVERKGRLRPGRMLLVDTLEGRIVLDSELKGKIARRKPYRRWLEQNRFTLPAFLTVPKQPERDPESILRLLRRFGYTREEFRMILQPMAINAQEPVGSMGTDTPLAVLSDRPKLLFNYFKQLFAQVTNPAIDPLREGLVMSLMTFTGKQKNLLDESPEHCRQLKLPHPILTDEDMARLRAVPWKDFQVRTCKAFFEAQGDEPPEQRLKAGLERLFDEVQAAIEEGASLVVLSDRDLESSQAAIPSLLAVSAVHQELIRRGLRCEAGLVVESGEPREVMHFCLLLGFGANAINPYGAFEAIRELKRRGEIDIDAPVEELIERYITAVKKGILKTMSKMGISTLRSYQGAQIFEAIGLNKEVIDKYFTGCSSRIGGVGLDVIAEEVLARHREAFQENGTHPLDLPFGGEYHFRVDGEKHMWNPETVALLQRSVRNNEFDTYLKFTEKMNDRNRLLCTLRGLFDFVPGDPVPLEEVESAESIVKRFYTGAMSHGSISAETHEALALGMNAIGAMSNTGEGGEDPERYRKTVNGVSPNCGIKQVASGRFGVTLEYLSQSRMLQIKIAQGAKPGEGGQLPGRKVTEEIARLRHSTPGVTLISPPPHHDIYSIEDLAQLIYDLKCSNPGVLVSVKLVAEVGVGTIAAGVAKGNADEVLISGYDGGTGASPLSSIKHAGIPWELGLAETQQVLVANGLRDRILVQVDGGLRTGRDVVIGALLGAERFGFGTAALVSLGCILMRKCHLGTCPVGVATQDPRLRKRFAGKSEHLSRYMLFVAEEVRRIMAQLGFRSFDEMVGRIDRLNVQKAIDHWKARGVDLSAILKAPEAPAGTPLRRTRPQPNRLDDHLDWQILKAIGKKIDKGERCELTLPIRNVHRTVGAILSNRIVKKHGAEGLPDGTVTITFHGSAGQSFGAWLAPGVTLKLIGDANDYLGKGLSGGRIVVQTPPGSPFEPHTNIIAGNVLLYGATSGELFINGLVGERFCIRNSGAVAVVEGVGDHACEYMTGGTVVVLGQTGRNFAAGMSGGIAYVLDEMQLFDTLCNLDMVDLEVVHNDEDIALLRSLIEKHVKWTDSARGRYILDNWRSMIGRFVKVIPIEYRKSLERLREREERTADFTPATEEVYPDGPHRLS